MPEATIACACVFKIFPQVVDGGLLAIESHPCCVTVGAGDSRRRRLAAPVRFHLRQSCLVVMWIRRINNAIQSLLSNEFLEALALSFGLGRSSHPDDVRF